MKVRTRRAIASSRSADALPVCVLFLFICQAAFAAEQGTVQVEVSPATIQLAPGDAADSRVLQSHRAGPCPRPAYARAENSYGRSNAIVD